MNILIAGDSITEGLTGKSYVKLLQQHRREDTFINLGLGGDTLKGIAKRTIRALRKNSDIDLLIFQAGHNDIILPSYDERSLPFKMLYRILKQRGSIPTPDVHAFERVYRHTLHNFMRMVSCDILVLTLSCVNENPGSREDTKRREFNAAIRRAAQGAGITVADVGAAFDAELRRGGNSYSNAKVRDIFIDGVVSRLPQGTQRISSKRGLRLTIDGVHINEHGAKLYAQVIMQALDSEAYRGNHASG